MRFFLLSILFLTQVTLAQIHMDTSLGYTPKGEMAEIRVSIFLNPKTAITASAALYTDGNYYETFPLDYFKGLWSRFKRRSKLLEQDQTLYSFRHTGAIDVYKRTGSIEKLKAAMGHSNIMVSLTYLRGLDVAELKDEDMPQL